MSDEPKLMPCPFCGSDDVGPVTWCGMAFIRCANCLASSPITKSAEYAANLWNARADTVDRSRAALSQVEEMAEIHLPKEPTNPED